MLWLALLEMLRMTLLRLLRELTALISILSKGLSGRSWLAMLVGRIYLGALAVISMSPTSLEKDHG